MSWMKTAAAELLGLFVDDGVFALAILALILGVGLLLPRLGLPPGLGGPLLAIGLAVALLASVLRAARR